jgi:signal transduction histidine kinase
MTRYCWSILLGLLLLFGLWATTLYDYLLFHCLVEMFSIVVAFGIFMLAWNSRHLARNSYLLFIGIAYLFIGGLDLIHTLAFKGMGVFPMDEANLSTQLWIAARYVESISFLVAPILAGRRLKANFVFLAYSMAMVLLLAFIFYWNVFPACFVEETGLTTFKKASEYIICSMLLVSIVALLKKRREFDLGVLTLLIMSILATIVAEIVFTLYVDVYGLSNLIGHYFKIISFYLIYRAIIETGLTKPFALLFRNLKQSENALRAAKENLEHEVNKRTVNLRFLAGKLITVQEEERRRLAREMHDDLSQRLALLAIEASKLEIESRQHDFPMSAKLQEFKKEIIKLSKDIHDISRQLHPAILDDLGLVDAIKSECDTFTQREEIHVEYAVDNVPGSIPRNVAICIYRIVQEGLRNIAKHAKTDKAYISLIDSDGNLLLTVRDDGIGFDTAQMHGQKGIGLTSIQERVRLIQGEFSVQSKPGEGTVIKVVAPYTKEQE